MDWFRFINAVIQHRLNTRYIELQDKYVLIGWDKITTVQCEIIKSSKEAVTFEVGYKENFNHSISNIAINHNTAQTNTVVYTPVIGKRYILHSYNLSVQNGTLSAQTIQLFDGSKSGNNIILNETIAIGGDKFIRDDNVFISIAVDNSLKITFTGNMKVTARFRICEVY